MATNATELVSERRLEDTDGNGPDAPVDTVIGKAAAARRDGDESAPELALAPLVDKIAYAFARGLVVAMKELENHIAGETRKVSDTVGRRLDTLQDSFQAAIASLQESDARRQADLADLRNETRESSKASSERMEAIRLSFKEQLTATAASLQEADGRRQADVSALRDETRESSKAMAERVDALCKELGVQQEDIGAIKDALGGFTARVDTIVERLDRQSEALRSMYTSYSQRETELEHLVEGLARLRAYPAPAPTNGL